MNAIDQWEQENAVVQMELLRKENAAFAALPEEERERILKAGLDRLNAFADAEADDDDEFSGDEA